jgi:signal transduction histidine kinase
MRSAWSSLRLRLIVAAAVGLCLGLALLAWLLISVYRDSVVRGFDERLKSYSRVLMSITEVDPEGRLYLRRDVGESLFDTVYSGWYWQIFQERAGSSKPVVVMRSRSLFDQALKMPSRWSGKEGFATGPNGERLRVVRATLRLPGADEPFLVLVGGDYSEVTSQVAHYGRTLLLVLGLLAAGVVIAVFLQVHFALLPLSGIRRSLQAIRQGRAERLEGDFPTEVRPLVDELNALIAHNEQVLSRARTEVGNLAHALKTPISVLRNEASSDGDGLSDAVKRETEIMRRQVDHHLARARAAGAANLLVARTRVAPRVSALLRAMRKIHEERGVTFESECPEALVFRGEAQDLDEVLGNVLDNAGKWASGRVELKASRDGEDKLFITIDDDGPGLSEDQRRAVLERGQRLDETVPGTGLGLSIVSDMVSLYGGSVRLETSPLGGLRVALVLPAGASG